MIHCLNNYSKRNRMGLNTFRPGKGTEYSHNSAPRLGSGEDAAVWSLLCLIGKGHRIYPWWLGFRE